ncbi:WD40 repeat domain-containing protein, partial [Candidatus Micrarchaeota archaeon]|nr:WD40 repeat domain-containing protein [Candidatus Micrarchaeota archaeon]
MKLAGLWVLLLLAPLAVAGELKVIDFPGSVSGSQGGVRSVQWSPDGSKIVLSVDGRPQSLVVFETAGWSQVSSTTRYGSPDYVKWSPDGSKLLFEGVDSGQSNNIKGDLLIVDAASWTLLKNMTTEAPWDYIFAVAWSPDGRRVASGYGNGTFITWDASTGQALDNIGGHYDAIRSIEWSPDGSKIATSSDDGSAKIWNSALRGNILLVWFNNSDSDSSPAVNKAVWSHDGSKIAFASRDKAVRVWSVSPWVSLLNMSASSSVNQVAWSPDGSKIAYASYENLEYAESVHVWDINSKKEVSVLAGHAKLIHALEWSPDGKMIASSSWDGTARIWDVTNLGAGGAIGNGSCVPGWCFSAQEEVSWPDAYGSIVHTGAMVPGIMTQGTLFSGEPDTKVLVFPSPTHALNVRSNGAGGYLHEGNATSSPFNLTGDLIEWAQLDEAARLQFTFELLDASTGQVLITETTGGAPGQWYARTIDASEFAGRSVRIRFRQHTTDYGLGWYSLVDDVRTIKNGQPTSDVKNGNFESVASTGPGGGGDLIPVPGEVNVTFRFMTRETVGGKLLSATPQELQGQPLLGAREGDLVGFKPEGDSLVGHKVEWFDEWNGRKYKLDTLQSLRSLYSFNSTVKIGVFSDAARSVPLTSPSAGQTAYFRVSARDALTGKPAIVRG